MAGEGLVYLRTEVGDSAYASQDTAVPSDYRRLLALIDAETHFDVIRGRLRQFPDRLLEEWLEELVELGFLQRASSGDPLDLDFTSFFAEKPANEGVAVPEDQQKLARDAKAASSALSRTGAYLSHARLKNRAPLDKRPEQTIVLIVEDDPDQLALADLRIAMAGYTVRIARTANELVETLRKDPKLDILLLDVMLPDGDGFDILGKMRRHARLALLPIVMLTAKDTTADIKRGLMLGADAYVTKPYSKNGLVDTIRKVLKQSPK